MKLCAVELLLALSLATAAFADSITAAKINEISHPSLNYNNPKPLIVDFQRELNGTEIERIKLVYHPSLQKLINVRDGHEWIEDKMCAITYFDAFELPDKKRFVLIRKTTQYEAPSPIQEIQLWDASRLYAPNHLQPNGTHLFLSADHKFLIAATMPFAMGEDISKVDATLYYYDLTTGAREPTKTVSAKVSEMPKLGLKKALNNF